MQSISAYLRGSPARWWLAGTALALVIGLIALGRGFGQRAELERPVRAGFRNSPPFYYASADHRPRGMAVDVLNQAAARVGATLTWVQITESSDDALRAGRIDLWPTLVQPQPNTGLYVTEPWLESRYFLLFRRGTGIGSASDVVRRRVALSQTRLDETMARRVLPGAMLEFVSSSEAKLQRLCAGAVDAAFVDGREADAVLLERPGGCEGIALDFLMVEGASWPYGIGVRPEHAALADRLRAEIDAMGEDDTLALIQARWSFMTSNETRLVYALQQARRRSQLSAYGMAVFGGALLVAVLVALWQARRNRQSRALAAEQARQEARYRVLFERNLAGVFRTTIDGRILDCNDAFAHMLGCESRHDLLTHDAWDFYPDRGVREAALAHLRQHGSMTNHETMVRRRDGRMALLLENTTLIEGDKGQPAILEGTILDITRQRELEEQYRQSQKLESIGRLAGGVAHDFNNTLTAINGYTELVLSTLDPASPAHAMMLEVRKAGGHAESLTRQLLAFSRRQHLQPKIISLNRVIAELRDLLRRMIGEDIELVTNLAPDLDHVRADPGQIQQVVMNLAVNARDAMPDGGRLTITTANVVVAGDDQAVADAVIGPCARLTVTDTGHGMDAETQGRAFEPFFTTKDRGKGTGLGLSTVYGIVKQSGGQISIRSAPGSGAAFDIDLPSVEPPEAEVEPPHAGRAPGGTETILVVEDQDDVRELVRESLVRFGYRVIDAGHGQAALDLVRQEPGPIDLLLADVVMPGMTGPAVAIACRQLRPGLKVLYMSGYTDNALRDDGSGGDAGAFIQKPFAPASLAAKVREVLDS